MNPEIKICRETFCNNSWFLIFKKSRFQQAIYHRMQCCFSMKIRIALATDTKNSMVKNFLKNFHQEKNSARLPIRDGLSQFFVIAYSFGLKIHSKDLYLRTFQSARKIFTKFRLFGKSRNYC